MRIVLIDEVVKVSRLRGKKNEKGRLADEIRGFCSMITECDKYTPE